MQLSDIAKKYIPKVGDTEVLPIDVGALLVQLTYLGLHATFAQSVKNQGKSKAIGGTVGKDWNAGWVLLLLSLSSSSLFQQHGREGGEGEVGACEEVHTPSDRRERFD